IKMVLALRHQVLPPTLHAGEPSPHVDWSAGQVRLLAGPVPWPADGRPRRAGISSFGISGTNAHAILDEPPAPPANPAGGQSGAGQPLLLGSQATPWLVSGHGAAALAAQAGRLGEWVTARPDLKPGEVAWSLAVTRSVLEHRAVVIGADREGLAAGLA